MSGRLSPHNFKMFSISPLQPCSFHCWFSNNSVLAFVVSVLSQDRVSLSSFHSILTFVPEALWCCSLQPISLFCQDRVLFLFYPFNRSIVSFCSSSFVLSSFSSLLNRSAVWDLSYPLFHSFNGSGGSVLWFHQVSSLLIKFLFNSFSFQTECCPNYIILNTSLSCFNRSGFNIYLALQPQGFRNALCPSFLTECFRPSSPSLYSFLEFVQPRKVLGFTRLSKKQLGLPLLFLFTFPSGAIPDLGTRSSRSGGVL